MRPCEQMERTEVVLVRAGCPPTDPGCGCLRAIVDYPVMLSRSDRGIEAGKRIALHFRLDCGHEEPVTFYLEPGGKAARWLDQGGKSISGFHSLTVTVRPDDPVIFYLEHTQTDDRSPIAPYLTLLPPTQGISYPRSVPLGFQIRQESIVFQWLRDIIRTTLPTPALITALGSVLLTMGSWVWRTGSNQKQQHDALLADMRKARSECRFEEVQSLGDHYRDQLWFPYSLFSREGETVRRYCQEAEKQVEQRRASELYQDLLRKLEGHETPSSFDHDLRRLQAFSDQYLEQTRVFQLILKWDRSLARQKKGQQNWLYFEPGIEGYDRDRSLLIAVLKNADSPTVVRRWAAHLLSHFRDREAGEALRFALNYDLETAVRAEAAWGLVRKARPKPVSLHATTPEGVNEWLRALPTPLEYNPCAILTAEGEEASQRAEKRPSSFYPHPAYEFLGSARHTMLLAGRGCGKTSLRLQFKSLLQEERDRPLVVEYTGFDYWLTRDCRVPSVRDHVDYITRQVALQLPARAELGFLSDMSCVDLLKRVVEITRAEQFPGGIQVLVDNVDAGYDVQCDDELADQLLRHLAGWSDILSLPGLTFHFFLPTSLYGYMKRYRTVSDGLFAVVPVQWSARQLQEMLVLRIQQASNSALQLKETGHNQGGILQYFVFDPGKAGPENWDDALIDRAGGCPRRLLWLVDLLFQHRAQQWKAAHKADAENSKTDEVIKIQPEDWAHLLEWLVSEQVSTDRTQG